VQDPADPKDPADPGYDWPSDLDEAVSEAAKYHIQIAFTVAGADADFATAAARRYPSVHLWLVPQAKSASATSFKTQLNGAYKSLKARSSKNLVIGEPRSTKSPTGLKMDLFGYQPAPNKRLPDLAKLHDAVGMRLFISGWTLQTNRSTAAATLTAGLKAARAASYVYTLGYDGLYDPDTVGSDGRTPQTGLMTNGGDPRAAFNAFKKG
jgi:hypothetical protein